MHEDIFNKRILNTKTEIFPLDRLLPLDSVYTIFLEQYNKQPNKEIFFKERKFQRLREGYFSLFTALSLNDLWKKNHLVVFPENPSNDVYILEKPGGGNLLRDQAMTYAFDIKEYTEFSGSFADFVQKSIIPNVGIYNLVIGTHKDIGEEEIKDLIHLLPNDHSKVWIIGASSPEDDNDHSGRVFILAKEGLIYAGDIKLSDYLNKTESVIICQDVLRIK